MKCPKCGFWNRAHYPNCFQCGAQLAAAPGSSARSGGQHERPDARDEITYEQPQTTDDGKTRRLAPRTTPEPRTVRMKPQEQFEQDERILKREFPVRKAPIHIHSKPLAIIEHEAGRGRTAARTPDKVETHLDRPAVIASRPRNAGNAPERQDSTPKFSPLYTVSANRKKQSARTLAKTLLAVTALAALVVAGAILYPRVASWLAAREAEPQTGLRHIEHTITAIMRKDKPAHEIVLISDEFESVYITELQQNYLFTAGQARFTLMDEDVIGDEPTDERIDVTLTPRLYLPSGRGVDGGPLAYSLDVQVSPVTLIWPETERVTVQSKRSTIKIKVETGSRVTLQGVDVSDFIDKDGNLEQEVETPKTSRDGDNLIEIEVRTKGHLAANITLAITRPHMDVPIELVNPPATSTGSAVEISGFSEPGSAVSLVSASSGEAVTDSSGNFTVKAKLQKIGENEVIIKAVKNGLESTYTHKVVYMPKLDEYSKQAWPMDERNMSDLVAMPSGKEGKVYVGTGKVTSISEDSLPVYSVSLITGVDVLIEMVAGKPLELDKSYEIYADFAELVGGKPKFIGRYYFFR